MDTVVVCVHGRDLQWRLEQQVLADFQDGLIEGMGRLSDPAPLVVEQIVLAFYGDLFLPDAAAGEQLSSQRVSPTRAANTGFQMNIAKDILQGAARQRLVDTDTLRRPAVDQMEGLFWDNPLTVLLLQSLDKVIGAPRDLLRLFVGDVDQYLHNPDLRAKVMERVIGALRRQQGKAIIVVAHSLGTVIAYDVMNTHPEIPVSAFVTLGSPLGLSPFIYDALLPPLQGQQRHPFPTNIMGAWNNFYDPCDVIALVPDLAPLFPAVSGKAVVSTAVMNNPDNHHSLTGYLLQKEVALGVREGFGISVV